MQEGMLFHDVARPRPGADIEQLVGELPGALDVPALVAAWEQVIAHHAILRTSFRFRDLPAPRQDVHRRVALPLAELDLRGLPPAEREARRRAFVMEDRARGFDLTRAPCLRLTLLRLEDARWDLVWTFHHLLLDGRSFLTVLRQVFACYEARREGREITLPEAPPFADFVGWLGARDAEGSARFWRALLADREGPTPLPVERPAPLRLGVAETSGRLEAQLSLAATGALQAQAEAHGLTLNTLVQGAWAVLLARHAGVADVVFGAVRAGRHGTTPGAEGIVGMTINTVPVRARVPPDAPLLPALRELRGQWVAMRGHEYAPLSRVRDWAGARGDVPLFETLLVVEGFDWKAVLREDGGLRREGAFRVVEWTSFPMTLLVDLGPQITLTLEYDRGRVADDDAARLLPRYERLLTGMAAGLDVPVGALPWLTDAELRQVGPAPRPSATPRQPGDAWNDTAFAHPTDRLVHEIVAAQAAATPDAVAVSFEGAELTYRALSERVNQLAHALRRRGVGPDVLVGVAMERSLELVVALHGVLAAGGAYVPLDPEYPRERLAFMLEDSKPRVILTQAHLAALDGLTGGAEILHLDPSFAALAAEPTTSPGRAGLGLDHLAYVIYTSGSTGRPKGAMNEHHGVLNRLCWMQRAYGLTAGDRVLQKTPFSFDVSVWELFWPLMFGARLVVARPGGHREPGYLARLIAAEAVTTVHFVPSMLKAFVAEPAARRCGSLRRILCSGEALPPAVADQVFALDLGAELHNLYGPTEAAIDVTAWQCQPGARVVPIGRPIDNVQAYVLDERGGLLPIGVPGELYLGGVQVGRGYLGRPELTAERFVPDPFSEAPGARLYRTGDLARWLPDGALEYRGRTDFQVKIRGFRVELGEIEAALAAHPRVRAAAVVARDDGDDGPRLVGYVEPSGPTWPAATELRAHLRAVLPEPMVPGSFVVLDRLPLTASGKLDRGALPAAEPRRARAPGYAPPRTPVEDLLAEIWAQEMGVPCVGVHDNYFDLGGNSLVSLRLVDRLAHAGLSLATSQLFQHQTIAELSAVLATVTATPSADPGAMLVAMRPTGARPPLFFVHTTPGDLFGYTSLVRALGPDQPCYGFQSDGLTAPAAAASSVAAMAASYLARMRTVAPRGPYHLAGWCYGGFVAFEMAHQLRAAGEAVGTVALIEAKAPWPGLAAPGYYLDLAREALALGPVGLARYLAVKARLARTPAIEALGVDVTSGPLANRLVVSEQNLRALAAWRPRPYPGRIVVLRGDARDAGTCNDPALRWRRLTAGVEIRVIAGSHESILRPPAVADLAAALRDAMDGAPPARASSSASRPAQGTPEPAFPRAAYGGDALME
jgi:amino acid adenylation domain-containing protein